MKLFVSILFLCFSLIAFAQQPGKKEKALKKQTTKVEGEPKIEKEHKYGPPDWAPAHGYRAKTRYVFFKDYKIYYDNERDVYLSYENDLWHATADIPFELKAADLKGAVQVEVEYDGEDPQTKIDLHLEL